MNTDDLTDAKKAITAYSQCEKLKSGLIWISNMSAMITTLNAVEKKGAESLLSIFLQMISDEIILSARVTNNPQWLDIGKDINTASVMVRSGVGEETAFHVTRALSKVTGLGGEAMNAIERFLCSDSIK